MTLQVQKHNKKKTYYGRYANEPKETIGRYLYLEILTTHAQIDLRWNRMIKNKFIEDAAF